MDFRGGIPRSPRRPPTEAASGSCRARTGPAPVSADATDGPRRRRRRVSSSTRRKLGQRRDTNGRPTPSTTFVSRPTRGKLGQRRDTNDRDEPGSVGEDGSGDEVGAEGGQDRQVQQAGRRHDGRVVALAHAARVTNTRAIVVTAHAAQNQPSTPFQPSSTAGPHREHPHGQQQGNDLDRPRPAECRAPGR